MLANPRVWRVEATSIYKKTDGKCKYQETFVNLQFKIKEV